MNTEFELMRNADFETLKKEVELANWNVNALDADGANMLFYDQSKIVEYLLTKGINIEQKDRFGNTALIINSDDEIRKHLIQAGADVNAINDNKRNALFYNENAAQVQFLIDLGINVNQCDIHGRNALCYAANKEVARVLLKAGIDMSVEIEDNDNTISIMDYLKKYRYQLVFDELLAIHEKEHIQSKIDVENNNILGKKKRI